MATPAQPLTSSTTLTPAGGKPQISVSGDSAVIDAIVQDKPFPDSPTDITIGQLNVQAQTAGSKTFSMTGIGNAPVTFSASASAYASLSAYQTPSKLMSDLGFQSDDGKLLNVTFSGDSSSRYMVVRWGFDVSGNASGKMALNPAVNLTFGGNVSTEGLFAFVLARIIREIEDARRLFCYKHVVKTVFVLQERLPACLTIARHSVCYSPTFSTSLPYCSSTNGWAVPMAGRFC